MAGGGNKETKSQLSHFILFYSSMPFLINIERTKIKNVNKK
jgi:hypothetical protein